MEMELTLRFADMNIKKHPITYQLDYRVVIQQCNHEKFSRAYVFDEVFRETIGLSYFMF